MPAETSEARIPQAKLKDAWEDPKTHALCLVAMVLDVYGKIRDEKGHLAAFTWRPETFEMEIKEDFDAELPAINLEKLMAALALLTEDSFFVSEPDFIRTCNAFSNNYVPSDQMMIPDSDDIAWGITEALLIRRPDNENPFSEAIVDLIGEILHDEGMYETVDVLRIANKTAGLSQRISHDWLDDGELYEEIRNHQTARVEMLKERLHDSMEELLDQLMEIPFKRTKLEFVAELKERWLKNKKG